MKARMAFLLAFVLCATAQGAEEPPGEAATRARRAHAAGAAKDLKAIAEAKAPDAWTVIEALVGSGDADVARSLAAQRPRHEQSDLAAYIDWRLANPARPEVLAAVGADAQQGSPAFLERAESLLTKGRGVSYVLLAEAHTRASMANRRPNEAIGLSMLRAAKAADSIGWHHRAFRRYLQAFERLFSHRDAERLKRVADSLVALSAKSGDDEETTDAHGRMAFVLRRLGRTEEARVHAEKSFKFARTKLQARNALRVVIMMNMELGNAHVVLRKLAELKELDIALGQKDGANATNTQLANYEARLGHTARAMARIERVLEHLKKHGAAGELAGAHMTAASISRHLHDPVRAIEHVNLAREAFKRARAAHEPISVDPHTLNKIESLCLALLGRRKEAVAISRQVVAGRTRTTPAMRIYDLMTLAIQLANLGQHEEVPALLAEAEALLGPRLEPHIHAHFHSVKASALVLAGKFDAAFEAAKASQAVTMTGLPREFYSHSAGILARVWFERGDMRRAVKAFDKMLAVLLARSAALPDRTGATFRGNFASAIQYAIEAAARSGDAATLFNFAERINSVALRSRLGAVDVVTQSLPPALRDKELALQESETLAMQRLRRAKEKAARKEALTHLGTVREQLSRHRERMRAEQSAAAQIIDPQIDDLASTRKRLAADESVVIFAKGIKSLWAVVVDRKRARIVNVGPRPVIVSLLDALTLEDPDYEWQRDLEKLRATLVKPLGLAKTNRRITLVPSGSLAFVPYATLFFGQEVTLLPSVATGHLLGAQKPSGKGTLAIGDPASADGRRLPSSAEGGEGHWRRRADRRRRHRGRHRCGGQATQALAGGPSGLPRAN